jgi:hypothetical protein
VGGRFSAPYDVDEGEPFRPDVVLWLDATNGLVVGAELDRPPITDEQVAAVLARNHRRAGGPVPPPSRIRVSSRSPERHAEVREDAADHGRILDRREQDHSPAALRTREDVGVERPAHELSPAPIPRTRPSAPSVIARRSVDRRWIGRGRQGRVRLVLAGHHRPSPGRVRSQDAVIQEQVDARARHQRDEPLEELHRCEHA